MRKNQSLTGLNLRANASKAVHMVFHTITVHSNNDHETLADHAKQIGTSARQRFKLIAKGATQELHHSVTNFRNLGKRMKGDAQHKFGIMASQKLTEIANKIEQKANDIHAKTINIGGTQSVHR
jgi:hypothetical protein